MARLRRCVRVGVGKKSGEGRVENLLKVGRNSEIRAEGHYLGTMRLVCVNCDARL